MKIRVVIVGQKGVPWADAAVDDYARRVRRWGGIDAAPVRAEPFRGDEAAVRAAEGERILAQLGPKDRLIVLDERGEEGTTTSWRALFDGARNEGANLVFAIGGAYGHAPEVRKKAYRTVRLSGLVLNHEVARVVLYEQIYRALAAIHGVPYAH